MTDIIFSAELADSDANLTNADLYAAIDLGSNSFHMIIAREVHGKMQVIDKHKEMIRLRSSLDAKGYLTEAAFQRALTCLERFGQMIKHIPKHQVRAVGTNTLRNAKNSQAFLEQAHQALGREIQVIAGQEEARLIYLGVAHGLPQTSEQRLVMDIGGGSTEYIIGQHFQNQHLTSTEMGCVSMTQAFFVDNQVTEVKLNQAIRHCRQILRPHCRRLKQLNWDQAIGASGSIKAIGNLLQENEWSEKGITLEGMQQLRQALVAAGSVEAANIKGLKEERIPVLLGGLVILIATFEELQIDVMQVSVNALREGLIFDTLGRLHADDARETSIQALQDWMQVDQQQAQSVANTALNLFHQVHNSWQLHSSSYQYRQLLDWAAKVHEVGMALSYKRYRHHSSYIVENFDMAGFSQQEKQMLSAMILNHRGKLATESFSALPEPHGAKLLLTTLLLRLAVRMHRGRENEALMPLIHIKQDNHLHLEFELNWLATHPLTQLDLEIEAERLAQADFTLTFS